jgi:hypothetical protein
METTSILMTIYEQFIEYCKTENFDSEYYEKHHIVPKHSGGTDDEENLIYLPPHYSYSHTLLSLVIISRNRRQSCLRNEMEPRFGKCETSFSTCC